ncbi:hypothetical protein KGD82_12150 [Nocardiopsis eucommiae]|uniref:non-specific serine/threonine protein kinase n=1 Tax=Nocardiopsis eucommiae TaxID=2831970 RepID=A0A975LDL8_9ACTN|nr:hypothetical protein KGD82_12150 [Nocardiopsis eucommiae]
MARRGRHPGRAQGHARRRGRRRGGPDGRARRCPGPGPRRRRRPHLVRPFLRRHGAVPGDYASALEDGGPLPLGEVLAVGRAVAGALDALHGRGLLHHRIEPGNILRAPEGAVLADMGGVTPVEGRPAPVGLDPLAVAYASPEALSGQHPLTPASDVYRLATVLWALLAGYPPFARGPGAIGDPFTYRERALSENPPRLPRADLPVRLRAVLDRALSREPGRRQDAAEFARDLAPGEPPTGALEPVPGANDAWGSPARRPGPTGGPWTPGVPPTPPGTLWGLGLLDPG